MARQLNARQKEILRKAIKERGITQSSELTCYEEEMLIKANDHETLWQNADRFISEENFKKLR